MVAPSSLRRLLAPLALGLALGGDASAQTEPPAEAPQPPAETPAAPPPPEAPPAITPPRVTYAEDPRYPDARLAEGEHPSVVFQVVIDREGRVQSALVEHSAGPDFDEAARVALLNWRFSPAMRGDTPIASRVRVAVHFELPSFDVPTTEAHAHDVIAVEGAPIDPARHEPPPEEEPPIEEEPLEAPPIEDEGPSASATVRADALRNERRAASDYRLDRATLELAPHRDAGHMLESAPGLVVTRPEGDAVAHRILLRGFDAEHGQDLELSVEGLPLNQPSHLHGQGYADLGFLVPEVVRSIRVTEGVYDPSQGDFAVAGSANFDLGVARRGVTAIAQMGSFRTFREALIVAPENEREDTFFAVQTRRTSGFGAQRAGLSASALGQWGFGVGPWRFRILGALAGARSDVAGVVRRDDLDTVGFYGTYADPSARSQNAFGARALLAFLAARRGDAGQTTDLSAMLGFTDYRSQMNFTGYTQTSQIDPTWRGRGDLVEQRNRATTLGLRFRHRSARFHPFPWLSGTLEIGSSLRFDLTEQSQALLAAPQNETWDRRIDASILGSDVGFWIDADLDLGSVVSLRGGVRADALFYDVDDRLGNFIPAYRRDDYILGFRRTAFGMAAGPRVSLDVHPIEGLSLIAAYGEGYRSPQAITLEDGERAPYTKVRSADLGVRFDRDLSDAVHLRASASGFFTQLSDDVIFEPAENRFDRIGASRRAGAVVAGELEAFHLLRAQVSVTGVRATLLDPPPATAEDPSPPFRKHQLLPYVPPVVVRADVGLHHTLGSIRGQSVTGSIGVGFSYVGRRPLPYSARAASFSLLDAQASVEWRGISLGLSGQNLLGLRYAASEYLFTSNWNPDGVASRIPERHVAAGAPRTLLFTIGVRP